MLKQQLSALFSSAAWENATERCELLLVQGSCLGPCARAAGSLSTSPWGSSCSQHGKEASKTSTSPWRRV